MTRIVVTGATGNVGLAVVRALAADPAVDSVLGLSRRGVGPATDKVEWRAADVTTDALDPLVSGADAVVHLAWLLQPSRREATTWRTNVVGTSRVLDAVSATETPAVVVASSVGAYSPGSKVRLVDESWPTHGVATSSYSRQKAYVERLLDGFECEHPATRVVRLRPGLVFQRGAGTEIRRYFLGPFLPAGLVDPDRITVFPVVPGLSTQVVHAADLAEAYRLAVTRPVRGAFNVAAQPALDMAAMAAALGARPVPVPRRAARALAGATWRLRLQPTDPGWLDLALESPLMDTRRATDVLGWSPTRSATDAFVDLLAGMGAGAGESTGPLRPDGPSSRVDEVTSGIGESDGHEQGG